LTAFFHFGNLNRAKLLKANPTITITEIAKQNGKDWKNITETMKKKCDALVEKDTLRYNKELKEF
jgi:hypothetical protein